MDEPNAAVEAPPPTLRARIKRTFEVGLGVVAVVASWNSYWAMREPTARATFVGFGLTFLILAPIAIWGACAFLMRLFAGGSLRRPTLSLVAAVAPVAASFLGIHAALRDFEQRRRPVYEKVIAAIRRDGVVDEEEVRAKREAWLRDLTPEERATFRGFRVERDGAGKLAVWFHWAGLGPPPERSSYIWFEAGRPDQETLRRGSFGSLGDGWYRGDE